LIGPNSEYVDDKNDTSTSAEGIKDVIERAKLSVRNIPMPYVITAFAGLRATEKNEDFVIGEATDVPAFSMLSESSRRDFPPLRLSLLNWQNWCPENSRRN
jgi:hypothetical protein